MAIQRIRIKEIHPKDTWYFAREQFEGKIFRGEVTELKEPYLDVCKMQEVPEGFVPFFGVIEPTHNDPYASCMSHFFLFVKIEPVEE